MNIWLLQIGEILPIETGVRRMRTSILADKLVNRGHDVLWWASSFDHFRKKWIFTQNMEVQINDGLRIKTIKGLGYKKNMSLARFFDHRIIALKFRKLADHMIKPNIIVASMPSYDLAYEAVYYAKKNNIPILVDIRDQWPDIFIENFPLKFQKIAWIVLKKEFSMLKSLLARADGLLSMTDPLLEWGLLYAGREKTWKDKIFYLGYSKKDPINNNQSNKIHALKDFISGKFVVTFVGTFGKYHNPSIMIECAKEFFGHNIIFILAGDGKLLEKLKKRAASLNNVFFPGWLNQDEITILLRQSHVGVCPSGKNENKIFFPNKAFAYFSEGLPILSSFQGEIEEIIKKYKIGFTYYSLESLVEGIKKLYNDQKLYKQMRENTLKLFNDKFNADKIYDGYAEHIERVALEKR
jgi:glycosyltransferase involved in cell wall biosynthesis